MDKVEELIDQQYNELSAKFRPVFGNQNHIYLVKDISKLADMEKELAKKLAAAKGGKP